MSRKKSWIQNTAIVTSFALLGLSAVSAHAYDRVAPRHALPALDIYSALDTSTDSSTDSGTDTSTDSGSDTSTDSGTDTSTSTLAAAPAPAPAPAPEAAPAPRPAPRPGAGLAGAAVGGAVAAVVAYVLQRLFNMPTASDGVIYKQLSKELGQRDRFVDVGR